MGRLIVLAFLAVGCSSGALPANSDRCTWQFTAPMQISGSTSTTWPGGVPADNAPRCNPSDGSNGYVASIGIWAPPVAATLNLQEGVQDVATWQDFTLNGCQSWRNGSALVEVDGNDVTAHIVADCATAEMHVDGAIHYRKSM